MSKIYNVESIKNDKFKFDLNALSKRAKSSLGRIKDKERLKKVLVKRLPFLSWLPKYKIKNYLLPDILSGFTVGIMNIPQGMAYSLLATLNPVNGLYISFFPLIIYSFLGTCRHLAIGKWQF